MAKQSGLGDALWVHGVDLSGDIGSLGRVGGGPAVLEMTGIDKLAMERVGGVRTGGMEFAAWFNPAIGAAHPTLAALPTADRITTYCRGTALGSAAACLVGKQLNYDPTRAADGALSIGVTAESNGYGLEWGVLRTAGKRTDSGATNGASVDDGAASAFGLQAYLHVFEAVGTSVTVKLQQSSDNGVGDAWADVAGGTFAAATGIGAQRIETARDLAVERYLRVVTTGVFSAATFGVIVCRNEVETRF